MHLFESEEIVITSIIRNPCFFVLQYLSESIELSYKNQVKLISSSPPINLPGQGFAKAQGFLQEMR